MPHFQFRESTPKDEEREHLEPRVERMGEQSFANMLQLWKINKNEGDKEKEEF